jgi:hypothetical protein
VSRTLTLCLVRTTDRTAFDVSACKTRVANPSRGRDRVIKVSDIFRGIKKRT